MANHISDHDHHVPSHSCRGSHDARELHGLRLALGSILSPKRFPTPSSSTSGTASPHLHGFITHTSVYTKEYGFSSHSPSSPAPGTPGVQGLIPPNTAIDRLSMSRSNSESSVPQMHMPSSSEHRAHHDHGLVATSGSPTDNSVHVTNVPTPKSRPGYIATLQSKSAWDALIHGSFS